MKYLNPYAERDLHDFGTHLRNWRKVRGLTAEHLASRAGISRSTLRDIEAGRGTTQFSAVVSVMTVVGMDRAVIDAADPYNHDLGRLRADLMTRERVRER